MWCVLLCWTVLKLLRLKGSWTVLLYPSSQQRSGLALPTIKLAVSIHAACVGDCWGRINSLAMCYPTAHHNYTHTASLLCLPPPHHLLPQPSLSLPPALTGGGGTHPHRIIIEWEMSFNCRFLLNLNLYSVEWNYITSLPHNSGFLGGARAPLLLSCTLYGKYYMLKNFIHISGIPFPQKPKIFVWFIKRTFITSFNQ
jgi:hypothetical protein